MLVCQSNLQLMRNWKDDYDSTLWSDSAETSKPKARSIDYYSPRDLYGPLLVLGYVFSVGLSHFAWGRLMYYVAVKDRTHPMTPSYHL